MSWCTRETNFKFGYCQNKYLQTMPAEKIASEMAGYSPYCEGFEIMQGGLAGSIAREFGVSLLPPECYDPQPLVRGNGSEKDYPKPGRRKKS